MKKLRKNWLILAFLSAFMAAPMNVSAVPLALDGSWTVLQETMKSGDFFTGSWSWSSSRSVRLDITDLYVITDVFEVYDKGVSVFTTPSLPDYAALGIDPVAPPYTSDPDVAWVTDEYSKGSYLFGAGSHAITIKDVSIPTDFSTGTTAFRATEVVTEVVTEVPEPSILALLGMGLAVFGLIRRRQRS